MRKALRAYPFLVREPPLRAAQLSLLSLLRRSHKVSMTVQDVRSGEVCRDSAVLLKYSVQVLSSLLRQEKHLQISVVDLDNIANRFSLLVPDPAEGEHPPCVLARIQDAGASCHSALQLRYQLAPSTPNHVLNRDIALRLKQQQHLQLLNPQDGSFCEAQLERKLLDSPPGCLGAFPYLFKREWTPADGGKGDLVFTDGQGLFAVVEVKHINMSISKNSRRRKRNLVRAQAQKYGQAFATEHPDAAVVIAGVYTELQNMVNWLQIDNQKINRVRMLVQVAAAVKANVDNPHSGNAASPLPYVSRQPSQAADNFAESLGQPRTLAPACVPRSVHTAHQPRAVPPDMSQGTPAAAEQQLVQQNLPWEDIVIPVAGALIVATIGCFVHSVWSARQPAQRQRE